MERGGKYVVVVVANVPIEDTDKLASILLFQNAALPSENVLVPPLQKDQRHPRRSTAL